MVDQQPPTEPEERKPMHAREKPQPPIREPVVWNPVDLATKALRFITRDSALWHRMTATPDEDTAVWAT
jgi:hypothetical protein